MTHLPTAARTTQATTETQVRAAYAKNGPRYTDGNVFDLRNEQTTLCLL